MTSLAAIVPATDSPPTLDRCLRAIESSSAPPEEVIVIHEPIAHGPAAARNEGAKLAVADVLVFVDSDVLVHPDAFSRVRAHFEDDPSLAAVFGAYDDAVETTRLTAAFRNLLHHHVHTRSPGPAQTFWAGLGAVRRDVFEAAGGFDDSQFDEPSIEDIELGMRLTDRGARIVLDPAVRGTHLKDWTSSQMLHTDLFRRGVPWIRLLASRRSVPSSLNLGARERASAVSAVVAAIAVVRMRPRRLAGALTALVLLNVPFYQLLVRRLGPRRALACVPLHAAHHLVAVISVPLGLASSIRHDHAAAGSERSKPTPGPDSDSDGEISSR